MSTDLSSIPDFYEKHHLVMNRLRWMVSTMRPTTMVLGLAGSLEELVDGLSDRVGGGIQFRLTLPPPSTAHYEHKVEEHVYRIVQQACENAIRHAQPRTIGISGSLEPDQIELIIEDDGLGMAGQNVLDFDTLLAKKQFGLAGMFERAGIIGAQLRIETAEDRGTRVSVSWSQTGSGSVL